MNRAAGLYKQCVMEKPTETGGKWVRVAWIPTVHAKLNRQLSIQDSDGDWIDGWVVTEVGERAMPFEHLDRQRDAQKRWESCLR